MSELNKILLTCLLLFVGTISFAQGGSLSPYDLKESYLEKRASYESSSTKQIASQNQKELDRIVEVLEVNAPASYEYHLVKYINGNFDVSQKNHLFEAYSLKPDALEVRKEMFGFYALTGDNSKQKEFALKIKNSYSSNVLNYYKVLVSNSKVRTVFLSGEEDAYPLLVLQSLGQIRNDISIVNLDFLQNDDYRKRVQKKLGMSNTSFVGSESKFLTTALGSINDKAFVSTTVGQSYIRGVADNCYLTGLHYQYSCSNQRKELDAFWTTTQQKISGLNLESRADKKLYTNFLPPLLTLYKLKIGAQEKDPILRKGIMTLAQKTGKETAVNEILKEYEQTE